MGPSAISRQRQGKANEIYGAGCVVQKKANEIYGAGCVVQKANEIYVPSEQAAAANTRPKSAACLYLREHGASLKFTGCHGLDLALSLCPPTGSDGGCALQAIIVVPIVCD
ncbi:hypothetical protein VF21_02956 [Pseudogymnoascus sp. 05NY08]|nr:hypothetical protein VF21_02956 [Pseudogymnoascus sp. 05NY08]